MRLVTYRRVEAEVEGLGVLTGRGPGGVYRA